MTEPANPHDYWVLKIKNANKTTLLRGKLEVKDEHYKKNKTLF